MVGLIVALLACVSGSAMVAGFIGRRCVDRPTCARCGTDARPFAWRDDGAPGTAPCSCGADLSRRGAVRLTGRRRRRPMLIVGWSALGSALVLIAIDIGLRSAGSNWWRFAPLSLAISGAKGRSSEAVSELLRRAKRDQIPPAAALALVTSRELSQRSHFISDILPLNARLIETIDADPAFADQLTQAIATLRIKASYGAWIDGPAPNDTFTCSIDCPTSTPADWIAFRVEAVRIDGIRCTWSLSPPPPSQSPVNRLGRRVVRGEAFLHCIPDELTGMTGLMGNVIECDVIIIRAVDAFAAPLDPLIDSAAPPEAWGVDAIVGRKTLTSPMPGRSGQGLAP